MIDYLERCTVMECYERIEEFYEVNGEIKKLNQFRQEYFQTEDQLKKQVIRRHERLQLGLEEEVKT